MSTAAAEKVYRSLGATDTRIATRLALGSGAVLEWIPQETILFDGARLERRLRAALAEDAVLLAAETLVFGRAARGERMRSGALLDAWRIHGPDGLLWADALALPDDPGEALGAPFGFNGAEALGTVLLAGRRRGGRARPPARLGLRGAGRRDRAAARPVARALARRGGGGARFGGRRDRRAARRPARPAAAPAPAVDDMRRPAP